MSDKSFHLQKKTSGVMSDEDDEVSETHPDENEV